MTDFATALFRRFGGAVLLGAGAVALLIWLLAHWTAAPGTEVTILWGFVSYTKPASDRGHAPNQSGQSKVATASAPVLNEETALPPALLEIEHGVSKQRVATEVFRRLRATRQLRELTVSESGRKVADIPQGTYFFVTDYHIRSERRWNEANRKVQEQFVVPFGELRAHRFGQWDRHAEVHYSKGVPFHLLNIFTNEDPASRITQLSGKDLKDISATVFPSQGNTTLVSLPIERIVRCSSRDVQTAPDAAMTVLDLVVR